MGDPATFRGSALGGNHLTDHRRGIRHCITSFLRREHRAGPCPAAGIGPPLPFPGPDHRLALPALGTVWTPIGNPCPEATLAVATCPHPSPRVPHHGLTPARSAALIPSVGAPID